jgi:transposase
MNIHQHARTTPRGRAAFVQRVARGAESGRDVAEALGVSEWTVRKWVQPSSCC